MLRDTDSLDGRDQAHHGGLFRLDTVDAAPPARRARDLSVSAPKGAISLLTCGSKPDV